MTSGDAFVAGQQAAWCGLFSLGLLFLFIAMRLREDKTFALLGVGILMLCLFVGVDIWILFPGAGSGIYSKRFLETSQNLGNAFATAYVFTALWFTRTLTGRLSARSLMIHGAVLGLLAAGLIADAVHPSLLMVGLSEGEWRTSWVYDWVFAPCLIGQFATVIVLTALGLKDASGDANRTLKQLLFAYGVLFLGGLGDFLALWVPSVMPMVSCSALGVLAMGVMGTFIFTDKLLLLYESRRRSLLQIADIHGIMDAHRPLGDLGRSAALISEEIRGYVSRLKNDALSLRQGETSAYRAEVTRIESARRKLEAFTNGILDFSKSGTLGRLSALDASEVVEACLERHFADCGKNILVTAEAAGRIRGDKEKLVRALAELLRNALQAGAATIAIRLREGPGAVSLAIEDDGEGIGEDAAEKIARPFFTTRKGAAACGLGASISEGIIKAHGGSLKFYPKSGSGARGLLVNVILPRADASDHGPFGTVGGNLKRNACLLVSDDGARIERFLAMCGNIGLRPLVAGPGEAWRSGGLAGSAPLVLLDTGTATGSAAAAPDRIPSDTRLFRLDPSGGLSQAGGTYSSGPTRLLCEETLIELMSASRR